MCRVAPGASDVDRASMFWRAFLRNLTGGDIAAWRRRIIHDLTASEDGSIVSDYKHLSEELCHVCTAVENIRKAAFDNDPSGQGGLYVAAEQLEGGFILQSTAWMSSYF